MATITDVQTAIHSKLQALVTDANVPLQITYKYNRPSELTKTPATTLHFEGANLDQFSPNARERILSFTIRLYIRNNDADAAETQLLEISDAILTAFDTDPTLGAVATRTMVDQVEARHETGDQDYRLAEFNVEVNVVNPC